PCKIVGVAAAPLTEKMLESRTRLARCDVSISTYGCAELLGALTLVCKMKRASDSPTLGTLFSITYVPIAGIPMIANNKTIAVTIETSTREKPRWRASETC